MTRWHFVPTAGCIAVLLSASAASACKCAVVSRDQTIASVPLVFEGRIVNIETQGSAQVATMAVVRSIKGTPGGQTIKVRSGTVSAACGYDFRKAEKTLLVGGHSAGRGTLSVRRCTMFNLNP
jgi:hypothetical protein